MTRFFDALPAGGILGIAFWTVQGAHAVGVALGYRLGVPDPGVAIAPVPAQKIQLREFLPLPPVPLVGGKGGKMLVDLVVDLEI